MKSSEFDFAVRAVLETRGDVDPEFAQLLVEYAQQAVDTALQDTERLRRYVRKWAPDALRVKLTHARRATVPQ